MAGDRVHEYKCLVFNILGFASIRGPVIDKK